MPVYNGAVFIRNSLESLLSQTFEDFEVVISDNASTDDTSEICKAYASRDTRIRYIRQTERIGVHKNFRYTLEQSVGQYFFWASYDDLRHNSFIEQLLEGFKIPNVVSSFCLCREIDEAGVFLNDSIDFSYTAPSPVKRVWKYLLDQRALRDIPIYGIHRRDVLLGCDLLAPWGWINKSNPLNTFHPIMIFILASGQFYVFREKELFYRRVVSRQPWTTEVLPHGRTKMVIAEYVRYVQLFLRSAHAVLLASRSILVLLATLPPMFLVLTKSALIFPFFFALMLWRRLYQKRIQ